MLLLDMARVHDCMTRIFSVAANLEPDRSGGYVCIMDALRGHAVLIQFWGSAFSDDAMLRCFSLSHEKAARLRQNEDHKLSWQSRDLEKSMYGGAIRARDFIFSFSGFSEHLDEAMMLALVIGIGIMTKEEAEELVEISSNTSWQPLRQGLLAATMSGE